MFRVISLIFLSILLTSCLETVPIKIGNEKSNANGVEQKNASDAVVKPMSLFASNAVDKECKVLFISNTLTENMTGLSYLSLELAKLKGLELIGNLANSSTATSSQLDNEKLKQILWAYSKNFVWLPMNIEQMYGDKEHEEFSYLVIDRTDKNQKIYSYADGMLQEVLSAIGPLNDYKFQLFILKRSGQNAMSLAGGRIYLDEKLVKDKKLHDQAIFALSHEVSHILQRHETKHIQTRLMDSIDLVNMVSRLKNVQSGLGDAQKILGGLVAGKQLFTKNYMDQEIQADACGFKLSSKIMHGDKSRINKTVDEFINRLSKSEAIINKKQLASNDDLKKNNVISKGSLEEMIKIKDIIVSPIDQHPSSLERRNNLKSLISSNF